MHLLLGDPRDPLCRGIRTVLEAHNYPTRIIANPLLSPSRFVWRLNNEQSASRLIWDDDTSVLDDDIAGVFVRTIGWIDPVGWQPDDLAYMQSETQAALLAWLSSLACPVVNRYPASIWYRPQVPLLSWHRLLQRCGLRTVETLVTNVEHEASTFGLRLALQGMAGAVYGPFTSDSRYLVTSDEDWTGLAAMQRCAPVCLTSPHGAAHLVCVVGDLVVWEGEPPQEKARLEPALRRFAAEAGLTFVELALAHTSEGICVIAVEPHPRFERFGQAAQQQIVDGIFHLLTAELDYSCKEVAHISQRSHV